MIQITSLIINILIKMIGIMRQIKFRKDQAHRRIQLTTLRFLHRRHRITFRNHKITTTTTTTEATKIIQDMQSHRVPSCPITTTTDLKHRHHDHNHQTAINNQNTLTMDTVTAHTRVQKQFKAKHLTHEART